MSSKLRKPFRDLLTVIRTNNIEFVRAELADINGISRGCTLDAEYFINNSDGVHISLANAVKGIGGTIPRYIDIIEKSGGGNAFAKFDYSTFQVLPWVDSTASILMDFELPTIKTPRRLFLEQIKKLNKMGLDLFSVFEFEFYLCDNRTNLPIDNDYNKGTLIKNNVNIPLAYDMM